jgi:hypothetical protein
MPKPIVCDRNLPASTVADCDVKITLDNEIMSKMRRDKENRSAIVSPPDFDKAMRCFQWQAALDRDTRNYVQAHPQQFNKPRTPVFAHDFRQD